MGGVIYKESFPLVTGWMPGGHIKAFECIPIPFALRRADTHKAYLFKSPGNLINRLGDKMKMPHFGLYSGDGCVKPLTGGFLEGISPFRKKRGYGVFAFIKEHPNFLSFFRRNLFYPFGQKI